MTETKSLAFKVFDRLISWFFLFVILFSLLGIALTLSGFPETYLFINPPTMLLASGILSCFFTFNFLRKELEKEWNSQLGPI
ncbi:MAG: hypothetical protein OEY39_08335 [Candidatus Bathyarchaeota archaeon]|nr:hypothetical protein [Candidatus Bathyarchaeota archaeon]MDH5635468.1 hypothetical protein [Candidatus Bathyarchaeota archaeon]